MVGRCRLPRLNLMRKIWNANEPRKKPSYFLLYWMVNRDPYFMVYYNAQYNWVGNVIPYITQPTFRFFSLLKFDEQNAFQLHCRERIYRWLNSQKVGISFWGHDKPRRMAVAIAIDPFLVVYMHAISLSLSLFPIVQTMCQSK